MKAAFIKWAINAPGVYNGSESALRSSMEDIETHIGLAWVAWKAAWRARKS
jgi:hypothetical protein